MTQIIIKYPSGDEIVQLTKETISLGRGSDNDISVSEEGISRQHCEIKKSGDDYYVVDLGSRNGILVNQQRVKEQKLVLGDRITIGRLSIIFEQEIPHPEESKTVALSQVNDFVVVAKKKQWGPAFLAIGIIILGIAALVIWRVSTGPEIPKQDKNLLGLLGSFDAPELQNGQVPTGWAMAQETSARGTITRQETHSGSNALMIEKFKADEFYAECRYEPLIKLARSAKVYSFGGWVKSDSFNKSLAGFKLEWFRPDENVPFTEIYTRPFVPNGTWQEKTISVWPPQDARAVRFTCLMAGTTGKMYFDDLKITPDPKFDQGPLEAKGFQKETTDLVLRGTSTGVWSLHTPAGLSLLRCGGLGLGSKTGEALQGFSEPPDRAAAESRSEGPEAGRGQIPFADPLKWLAYEIDFKTSGHFGISYFIPYQKASLALTGSYIRFIVDPQILAGKIKILSEELAEFPYNETISQKNVSRIDLEIVDQSIPDGRQVVSIKYSQPLEVVIETRHNVLEFRQGWLDKRSVIQHGREGIRLALEIECSVRTAETLSGVYNQMWAKAQRLEETNKLGQALAIYSRIVAEASRESEIWPRADERRQELNKAAQVRLASIKRLIQEMDLLNDLNTAQQAIELCQTALREYQGSEFANQAELLQTQIKDKMKVVEAADLQRKISRFFALAEGYFQEEKWVLARTAYEEVIRLGQPEDATVSQAEARLKEIEIKETTDQPE